MTDFQEKIAKTRATEGELQRTIAALTPVQSARVHIATPEATLYSTTQQPTTASIAIQTKPGMQMGAQEVRGITQLVAGAVEASSPRTSRSSTRTAPSCAPPPSPTRTAPTPPPRCR